MYDERLRAIREHHKRVDKDKHEHFEEWNSEAHIHRGELLTHIQNRSLPAATPGTVLVYSCCGNEVERAAAGDVMPCATCAKQVCTFCAQAGHRREDCPVLGDLQKAGACITPNGRLDGHMGYVKGDGHGGLVCAFCGKADAPPPQPSQAEVLVCGICGIGKCSHGPSKRTNRDHCAICHGKASTSAS